MSNERRYDEKEIASIFERASEAQKEAQSHLGQGEGLTLSELQEIGAEAGLTPEFIAQAATAIDHTVSRQPRTRYFGVPVGVSRTAELPAPLSDDDWERLVVDLRATFRAHGKVERHGSLRQWTNGNLKALIEPTATGQRLRLETRSENLIMRLGFGALFSVMMLLFTLVVLTKDPIPLTKLMFMGMMVLMGAGFAGTAIFKAPRWAGTREKQMEAIIERATRITAPAAVSEPERATSLDLDALPDQETVTSNPSRRTVRDRH